MRVELTEVVWLEQHALSFAELVDLSGLPREVLQELIEAGGIVPLESAGTERRYGARALVVARHARRLREDFDLDTSALVLALGLSERIGELEAHLRELQAQHPHRRR